MSEHQNMIDRIAAYITGGLDEGEKREFETHLSGCGDCASALEQSRGLDAWMAGLFGPVRPDNGFEDRIVGGLRPRWRMSINPAVWRVAGGIAAALVLGAVGYRADWIMRGTPLVPQVSMREATGGGQGGERLANATSLFDTDDDFNGRFYAREESTRQLHRSLDKEAKQVHEQLGRQVQSFTDYFGETELREKSIKRRDEARKDAKDAPVPADGTVAIQAGNLRVPVRDFGSGSGVGSGPGNGVVAAGDSFHVTWADTNADGKADLKQFKPGDAMVSLATGKAVGKSSGGTSVGVQWEAEGLKPTDAPVTLHKKLSQSEVAGKVITLEDTAGRGEKDQLAAGQQGQGQGKEGQDNKPAEPATSTGLSVAPPAPQPPQTQQQLQARKIIRNGELSFEVDSFDSSFLQITRIVVEEGGFVSSTNSEKLANGKVRGTVVVRIPPDHLDVLVLKLRALGDLKSQRIAAQDVTKVYYDLESELKAARAMEERLLNIIKSGKGEIKDLLEAEKQLGTYREKIEKLEGEVRYYNNLVSLSTLSITLTERDIRQAAFAAQIETVNMGIETDAVDKARDSALKAIEEAKGRVIESNLKNDDAGQFMATIVAEVQPDLAGPLIDRMRQLGRVARLNIDRKQTAPGDVTVPANVKVERKETRLALTFYNLANVAPRRTSNLSVAVTNVEEAHRSILDLVGQKGGRVVASTLNRQKPEQTTADIRFEVPSADADATLNELRRERDVLSVTVTENPDTNNVTSAKRGFVVQLRSLASVPARQSEQMTLAAKAEVRETFNALLEQAAKMGVRLVSSQLDDNDHANVTGTIELEVMREAELELRNALAAAAYTVSRNVTRSTDAENTVDTKVRLRMQVIAQERLDPRQNTTLMVEVPAVSELTEKVKQAAAGAGGRVVSSQQAADSSGQTTSETVLDVPLSKADAFQQQVEQLGKVRVKRSTQNLQTPDGEFARARYTVTLASGDQIVANDQGLGTSIRNALSTSVRGLLWSLQLIVIGLLMVGPWALLLWAGWKLLRRKPASPAKPAASGV